MVNDQQRSSVIIYTWSSICMHVQYIMYCKTVKQCVLLCNYWGWDVLKYVLCVLTNVQVKLLHCYINDFVSFSGVGIELGNPSGHRTLITFCKLIANYTYIMHIFSWLFSQHGQGKWNLSRGKVRKFWKIPWMATMIKVFCFYCCFLITTG